MRSSLQLLLTSALMLGCGPTLGVEETSAGGTGSAGSPADASSTTAAPEVCQPDALTCEGSEYGTWRLSSPDDSVVAYLYLWPDGPSSPRSFVSRWFIDDVEQEYCIRNGTYALDGDLNDTLVFETVGLGGTFLDICGGEPGEHTIQLAMSRRANCSGEVFALTATDSNGASLYAFEGEAIHCGCSIAYDPYSGLGGDIPSENCIAP